jgi:hypothetical protein
MINEDNWLSEVIGYLEILKQVYDDEVMPTMIDDSDHEERIEELEELINYLQKTN